MVSFEEIEHTADWAFRVTGRELGDLLENAARAMQALDGVAPNGEPSATREIEAQGIDRESLLVNWLNEILFLEQTHQLVCERFHIYELNDYRLRARVETRECQESQTHIKAATFHNLKVRETSEGLEAEVVLDV
ncbi:MAG: archease [Acidobacteriia bacterium]|nr:archease [Terriglobia bacterium]